MARVLIVGEARGLEDALRAAGYEVRTAPEPASLGPLMPELEGVSVVCWLAGAALLGSFAAKLVDTHVRGFACEASGAEVALRFAETYRMPTAVIADGEPWVGHAVRAVEAVIA